MSEKKMKNSLHNYCTYLNQVLLRKAMWVLVEDGNEKQDGATHPEGAVHWPLNSEHTSEEYLRKPRDVFWWYMEYNPKIFFKN